LNRQLVWRCGVRLAVFAKTLEELGCGWLEGPFGLADLHAVAVVSRLFGIKNVVGAS